MLSGGHDHTGAIWRGVKRKPNVHVAQVEEAAPLRRVPKGVPAGQADADRHRPVLHELRRDRVAPCDSRAGQRPVPERTMEGTGILMPTLPPKVFDMAKDLRTSDLSMDFGPGPSVSVKTLMERLRGQWVAIPWPSFTPEQPKVPRELRGVH